MPDVLETLNLRGLYEKIGNLYLKVEQADLSEETSGENDASQNLYLFNALESQVYDCQTTIYGGEKVATLLYLLLNQVDNKGPFLYPGMQEQLEQMEQDLPTLVKQINELNFSELKRILELIFATETGYDGAQIDFPGYDSDTSFAPINVQPTLAQVTVIGGKRKSKARKTKDKKRAKRMAKRNKKTKRKLKRVVRQTRKNRKTGRKQTRRKVNKRK